MIPILFSHDSKDFSTNGIGALIDAISCNVTEERNGSYELTMTYPVDGAFFSDIGYRSIIKAIPSPYRAAQPFRVYKITKPLDGIVTILAYHLSYDLSGIPVRPFIAGSPSAFLAAIKTNSIVDNPFEFNTSISSSAGGEIKTPRSARQCLGGSSDSALDIWGGEYEFDEWSVNLHSQRGVDKGVTVVYGKNMTGLTQSVDGTGTVTGAYAFWSDSNGENMVSMDAPVFLDFYQTAVEPDGSVMYTSNLKRRVYKVDSPYSRIVTLDFSSEFEEQPTVEQLEAACENYLKNNGSVTPAVNCKVSFVPIEQTTEYENIKGLEYCDLCDTVYVNHKSLGVSTTAKVVKINTNVLLERYNSIELGTVRADIAQTITVQKREIDKKPSIIDVNKSLSKAMGVSGGAVRLLDTDGDGNPDEIYIADNADPANARKVWRFNYSGWSASQNGYDGPFVMGATLEDGLLAEFITAANLVAGTIRSADGESLDINLDSGSIFIKGDFVSGNETEGGSVSIRNGILRILQDAVEVAGFAVQSGTQRGVVNVFGNYGTGREVAAQIAATENGGGIFLYDKNGNGTSGLSFDSSGNLLLKFDKVDIGTGQYWPVDWVWNDSMQRYVLCTVT